MLYFFHGEDTFTLREELQKLKVQFADKFSKSGIEELSLEKDISDHELLRRVQEVVTSQGLFSAEKLVILWNFLAAINKYPLTETFLKDSLGSPSVKVQLVFAQSEPYDRRLKFFKQLQKVAETREFAIPVGPALWRWVIEYVAKKGYQIEQDALAKFVALLGEGSAENPFDLWQVSQELEKLMLFCQGTNTINLSAVQQVVTENIEQNVFSLTNLATEGRVGEAVLYLDQMIGTGLVQDSKSQGIQILGVLASQLRSMLLVKDLAQETPQKIAKTLGWKEGRVWINLKMAKKFTKQKLIGLLRDLRAIDLRFKTSEEPPKLLLTLFFQKVGAK